jgi:hypothetical protein
MIMVWKWCFSLQRYGFLLKQQTVSDTQKGIFLLQGHKKVINNNFAPAENVLRALSCNSERTQLTLVRYVRYVRCGSRADISDIEDIRKKCPLRICLDASQTVLRLFPKGSKTGSLTGAQIFSS